MKASVTKIASVGVSDAIQRAARSWGRVRATTFERTCHNAIRPGEIAATTSTPTMIGLGHRWINQAARIATGIHMIWKYLFMSNATELTTTRLGTRNIATSQVTRNQRPGNRLAVRPATTASANGIPRLVA